MRWQSSVLIVAFMLATAPVTAWEREGNFRFSGVDRVIVVGDVHGAATEFRAVLRKAGVIDGDDRWIAGDDHLVSVGDLLDRGDDSRAAVDLLRALMDQAEAAGGKVHMILGNHEIMNLTGDVAYVTPGEFASYADLAPAAADGAPASSPGRAGHRRAFASDGPYGSWLLSLPFAIVVNGLLFVHGGVSDRLAGLTLAEVNERAHADLRALLAARERLVALGLMEPEADNGEAQRVALRLRDGDDATPAQREAAEAFLVAIDGLPFHPDGPTWHRRNAVCHRFYDQAVAQQVLDQLGARRVVVGHTPTIGRTIQTRFDEHVVLVDTGMNTGFYEGHPSALVVEGDQFRALYTDHPDGPPDRMPPRIWERPYGMSDDAIEAFLSDAEIIEVEDLSTGVTRPQRLTLRSDGREMRAVFKTFDSDPDLGPRRWHSRRGKDADRYVYDVAAYRLDRILGLHMVPPAVLRTIDGREGVVQYWLENTINARDRQAEGVPYTGYCRARDQYDLMNVFDALIHNKDRNLTNILFTRSDWKVWLIDHSRAFSTDRGFPDYLPSKDFKISPQLRRALEGVDLAALEPLGRWLHGRQLRAIEQRAEQLVKLAD